MKAGFAVFQLADEKGLTDYREHSTQHVGFDILIEKNRWLFIPGFHYYRMGLSPEEFKTNEIFSERTYMDHVKMPLSLGYHFKPASLFSFSIYTGGNFNFFISVDDNDIGLTNGLFHGVQVHGHIGIQALILKHITLDFIYEHGFLPIYNTRIDSKIRGPSVSLGVIF
jgi:hypothetical protein